MLPFWRLNNSLSFSNPVSLQEILCLEEPIREILTEGLVPTKISVATVSLLLLLQ